MKFKNIDKICKKCRYFSQDHLSPYFFSLNCVSFICIYDYDVIGSLKADKSEHVNELFKIPEKCPYILEHLMADEV
jgi:hypothetical protein